MRTFWTVLLSYFALNMVFWFYACLKSRCMSLRDIFLWGLVAPINYFLTVLLSPVTAIIAVFKTMDEYERKPEFTRLFEP